jgi:uncharacterized membrane protein YraQ (UPF0718 family)
VQADATTPVSGERRGIAPLLGAASVLLLAAAFRWAHHWGFVADSIVLAWAVATLGGLVVSLRSLAPGPGRRAALVGLALVGVSVGALVVTGIAMAAGADPAGACGGL